METVELLHKAVERYGKRGLAQRIGINESSIYLALQKNRPLRPEKMLQIEALLKQETTIQPDRELERLIIAELPKLTEEQLKDTYKFILKLQ